MTNGIIGYWFRKLADALDAEAQRLWDRDFDPKAQDAKLSAFTIAATFEALARVLRETVS